MFRGLIFSGLFDIIAQQTERYPTNGEIPKWSKGPHSKCGSQCKLGKGSNPFLSAIQNHREMMNFSVIFLFTCTFDGKLLYTLSRVRALCKANNNGRKAFKTLNLLLNYYSLR